MKAQPAPITHGLQNELRLGQLDRGRDHAEDTTSSPAVISFRRLRRALIRTAASKGTTYLSR